MTTISASIRRYRLTLLLTAVTILAITALTTSASAWTSEEVNPAEKEYRSAYLYYAGAQYWRAENVQPSYTSIPIQPSYAGFMSYPVSHIDDATYIDSASITLIARNSGSITVKIKVMDREFHELDPEMAMTSIWKATSAGTVSISTGLAYKTYTFDITGTSLNRLRDVVSGDDTYLVIAFEPSSMGFADIFPRYGDLSGTYYSTLTLEYDDEAPDVPVPNPLPAYSIGDHVPVSWSAVPDKPSGGSRGDVTYQVGVYLPEAPVDNTYHTSPWLDGTYWNLTGVVENIDYTFRVRARDGSGFESGWSDPVSTTVDNSPPSVPYVYPEPEYTFGINNTFRWHPSSDGGSGVVGYVYFINYTPIVRPVVIGSVFTDSTSASVLGARGVTSIRVKSRDALGHESEWSLTVFSTMDPSPPSVPVMFEEPEFTPGDHNVFQWHPAMDEGVGIYGYMYQVTDDPDFPEDTVTVLWKSTVLMIDNMDGGVTYFCRVKAVDLFGYESDWSDPVHSTQDASPPSTPIIHPLPRYMPEGSVTLTWGPAVDQGVGVTRYQVWWDRPGFPGPPVFLIDVIGQSFTLTNLGEGNWTFGVRAVDAFGHPGPFSQVETIIDATPPTAPVLSYEGGFSKGTSITLSWSPSTDASGVAGYRLSYHPEDHLEMVRHIETETTQATVPGLQDNVTYLYTVRATDVVGNHAEGQWIEVTADDAPPWHVQIYQYPPTCFNGTSFEFAWLETHDVGVGGVEYNIFWDHVHVGGSYDHSVFTMKESGWMTGRPYNVTDLEERQYHAWVIARDAFGHSSTSTHVQFTVDLTGPEVTITSPAEGTILAGTVLIRIMVEDLNLDSYYVQYRLNGDTEWKNIINDVPIPGGETVLVHWETTGLPDGDYTLRVTAEDAAGHAGSDEVIVELRKDILYPTEDEAGVDEGTGAGVYLGALALVVAIVALLVALSSRRRVLARDMVEWEESGH